jgi:hypothetical protein
VARWRALRRTIGGSRNGGQLSIVAELVMRSEPSADWCGHRQYAAR